MKLSIPPLQSTSIIALPRRTDSLLNQPPPRSCYHPCQSITPPWIWLPVFCSFQKNLTRITLPRFGLSDVPDKPKTQQYSAYPIFCVAMHKIHLISRVYGPRGWIRALQDGPNYRPD